MDPKQKARYEARAQIVRALAHATRLQIVDELARQPLCVSDIREAVGSDLSTVSRHLGLLKNAGLIKSSKSGAQVFYHLQIPCAVNFFACAERVLKKTTSDQMRLV